MFYQRAEECVMLDEVCCELHGSTGRDGSAFVPSDICCECTDLELQRLVD